MAPSLTTNHLESNQWLIRSVPRNPNSPPTSLNTFGTRRRWRELVQCIEAIRSGELPGAIEIVREVIAERVHFPRWSFNPRRRRAPQ
jgi:hypothetical protein